MINPPRSSVTFSRLLFVLFLIINLAIHIVVVQATQTQTIGLWTKISSDSSAFPARVYHSSVFDPTSNKIYTFFGTNRSLTVGSQSYTDIWTFDIASCKFILTVNDSHVPDKI
jgi:hypothetical protein